MALTKIVLDGSETGVSAAEKINMAFDTVDTVEQSITTIEGDITTIEGDITTIEGDITTIEGDITAIEGDITTIEGDITAIQSNTISTLITKTVASSTSADPTAFDFQSLHEALLWVSGLTFIKTGYVDLNIDDGIHYLKYDENIASTYDTYWCLYTFQHSKFTIRSISNIRANCIIEVEENIQVIGEEYDVFYFNNCYLQFYGVTINGYIEEITFMGMGFEDSYCVLYNTEIGSIKVIAYSFTQIQITSSKLIDSALIAIGLSANISCGSVLIQDYVGGAAVESINGARMVLTGCVFSNNTTNTNIPLNQIQYDGSYISNKLAPLTLKP